jgi:hypothetical protein
MTAEQAISSILEMDMGWVACKRSPVRPPPPKPTLGDGMALLLGHV